MMDIPVFIIFLAGLVIYAAVLVLLAFILIVSGELTDDIGMRIFGGIVGGAIWMALGALFWMYATWLFGQV